MGGRRHRRAAGARRHRARGWTRARGALRDPAARRRRLLRAAGLSRQRVRAGPEERRAGQGPAPPDALDPLGRRPCILSDPGQMDLRSAMKRRLPLLVVSLLGLYLAAEAAAWLALSISSPHGFSRAELDRERGAAIADAPGAADAAEGQKFEGHLRTEVLHPY